MKNSLAIGAPAVAGGVRRVVKDTECNEAAHLHKRASQKNSGPIKSSHASASAAAGTAHDTPIASFFAWLIGNTSVPPVSRSSCRGDDTKSRQQVKGPKRAPQAPARPSISAAMHPPEREGRRWSALSAPARKRRRTLHSAAKMRKPTPRYHRRPCRRAPSACTWGGRARGLQPALGLGTSGASAELTWLAPIRAQPGGDDRVSAPAPSTSTTAQISLS